MKRKGFIVRTESKPTYYIPVKVVDTEHEDEAYNILAKMPDFNVKKHADKSYNLTWLGQKCDLFEIEIISA